MSAFDPLQTLELSSGLAQLRTLTAGFVGVVATNIDSNSDRAPGSSRSEQWLLQRLWRYLSTESIEATVRNGVTKAAGTIHGIQEAWVQGARL
jgi:hypothetical protein